VNDARLSAFSCACTDAAHSQALERIVELGQRTFRRGQRVIADASGGRAASGSLVRMNENYSSSNATPTGDLGFGYRRRKSGDVEILHRGKLVATLRGAEAHDFIAKVELGEDAHGQQLMARLTGNYKRGNERTSSNHPRNQR